MIRTRAALAALALMLALATAGVRTAGAQDGVPITFSHGRHVDIQRLGAEPEIKSDSKGNIYVTAPIGTQYAHGFLWKSEDDGASFDFLRAFPPLQRPMPSAATGDTTMALLPGPAGATEDALVWSDMLTLAGLQNAASFDGGNSFPADHWNYVASEPGADRQWLTWMKLPGTNTYRIYQFYDQYPFGNAMIYTDDYGVTWATGSRQQGLGQPNPGNVAADPVHGKVYAATVSGSSAIVSNCDLNGQDCDEVVAGSGTGGLAHLFDTLDVDTAGNVYVSFTDAKATYVSVSTDQGVTWRKHRVSPVAQKATVFPWVVAGDPGRAWILWYGTANPATPGSNVGPWETYGAQSLNLLDANPTFQVVKISEHVNHDNAICESGIGCTAGNAEDRNMLDDFTADIDPQGMLHVAYNDTNNQLTLSPVDAQAGGAFIIESKQLSGPSLYEEVGDVVPAPAAPQIASTNLDGSTLTVTGAHSLPPANWATDAAGDARIPRHGLTGTGPNDPALDIRSVWLTNEATSFRMDVELAAQPTALTAGGRTVTYLVFYWLEGRVHFFATEAVGGVFTHAWGGYPLPVTNQAGVPKLLSYQPNNNTRPITVTPTPKGFALSVSVPLTPGQRLDQVTAFAFLPNGGPGAEFLMDPIEQTPATSWVAGDPRKPAGTVQVSLDDASFASPAAAALTDYPGTGFSAGVDLNGLAPGEHVLYVRQIANGFAGPVAEVPFTVP